MASRKAKLWTKLNPTISKDNTMGEAARQAKMLAEFAKNRPYMFGVKFDLQTSVEDGARPPIPPPPGVRPPGPQGYDRREDRQVPYLPYSFDGVPSRPPSRTSNNRSPAGKFIDLTAEHALADRYHFQQSAGLEDEMKAWRARGKEKE